jgi:putative FmdB family regulatory protein
MPIYEYICEKCGENFEDLVFGDKTPSCPKCGNTKTKKLLSCPCIHGSSSDDVTFDAPAQSSGCGCCAGGHCASCGH